MVAKRVRTYCPPSDRTTQEVSELTATLSGLVQQRAEQNALLTAMLRHNMFSERPVPAPARAARQLAPFAHQAASGMPVAKLAENQVAVDAELADAILRGTAAHGQEGNDGPVGRGRSFVLLPIHF